MPFRLLVRIQPFFIALCISLFCLSLKKLSAQDAGSKNTFPTEEQPEEKNLLTKIRELNSSSYSARQAAERFLSDKPQARERILKLWQDLGPEGQVRSLRLMDTWEREAENRKWLTAPKIRFEFKDVILTQVLSDVNKKAGISLELAGTGLALKDKKITLETDELPMWEAVNQVLEKLSLGVALPMQMPNKPTTMEYSGRTIRYNGPAIRTNADRMGLTVTADKSEIRFDNRFRVRVGVLPANHFLNSRVRDGDGNTTLNLSFCVQPPTTLPLKALVGMEITRAQDENGTKLTQNWTLTSLTTDENEERDMVLNANNLAPPAPRTGLATHLLPVSLHTSEVLGKKLSLIEGRVHLVVLGSTETIASMNCSPGNLPKWQKGDTTVTVNEIVKENTAYSIRAVYENVGDTRVDFAGPQGFLAAGRVGNYDFSENSGLPKFEFVDAQGKVFPRVASTIYSQTINGGGNGMQQTTELILTVIRKKDMGELAQMRLIGKKLVAVSVPFSFQNVQLP